MRRAPLAVLALVVGGCAVGSDDPSTIESPSTTVGRPAIVVTTAAPPGATTAPADGGAASTSTTSASASVTTSTTALAAASAGRVDDAAGDEGIGGPPYADVRAVELFAAGKALVVRVTFAGPLPGRLPDGEVAGVGVDLFTSASAKQSDWQVFADGEPDGWYGYLDGPRGPVALPGTLTVDGATLTFELPWSAVGDPRAGSFSAFADWTRDGVPLNTVTQDHAPDSGRAAFRRS